MAGKRIRSRTSQSSISISNLMNRPLTVTNSTNTAGPKPSVDLLSLTKEQLKIECRKRGQKTSGTKTELVRLLHVSLFCLVFCDSFVFVFLTFVFACATLFQVDFVFVFSLQLPTHFATNHETALLSSYLLMMATLSPKCVFFFFNLKKISLKQWKECD